MRDKNNIPIYLKSSLSRYQKISIAFIILLLLGLIGLITFSAFFFSLYQLRIITISLIIILLSTALFLIKLNLKKQQKLEYEIDDISSHYRALKMALNQHAIVSISDKSGNIISANDKFCRVSGYSKNELIGKPHSILRSQKHSDAFYEEMWNSISNGKTWHGDICNKTSSGTYYWVNSTIYPVLNSEGKPFQYIAIRTEITEQKRTEKRLSQERHFLKGLLDALGDGVYVLNEKGLCTFANPQAEKLLNWSMAELRGKVIHNLIHSKDGDGNTVLPHQCPIMLTVSENKVYRSEDEVFTRRGGEQFPVSVVSVPMLQKEKYIGSVSIFKDIREQKQREKQLTEATQQAKEANHAKSDFLSRMSHELRTPMNAILGFGQLLELNEDIDEDDKEYIDEILKAGAHLLKLINEVLDLSKIEAGRIDLSIESVDSNEVIQECVALTAPLADERGISIHYTTQEESPLLISSDRTRLKQIMVNLLSNAIKYNNENGEVRIEVFLLDNNFCRIKVSDNGIGMPKARLGELFSPFSRLVADPEEIQGTGIGLVISRQLAEAMNGQLNFDSQEGIGSAFWVDLPSASSLSHERDPSEIEDVVDINNTDQDELSSNATILYIEDNPANLKLVERVIRKIPEYTLITSLDSRLGIELAEKEKPDLVLLDIHMPGLTGIDVIQILKKETHFSDTPFIAISANAMQSDIDKAYEAGFDAYLTKPLDIDLFLKTLKKHLT